MYVYNWTIGVFYVQAAPVPIALPPFSIEITKGDQRLCFHMELVESADSEQPGECKRFLIVYISQIIIS